MRTIQIEDDVYRALKGIGELGEDASSILRRILGNTESDAGLDAHQAEGNDEGSAAPSGEPKRSDIYEALQDSRFSIRRTAVDRFLFLLSWINAKRPEKFKAVVGLGGRSRRYFAHNAADLSASGSSVNPQQIPDSDFWV